MQVVDDILAEAGLDRSSGFQVLPAAAFESRHHPASDIGLPLIVTDIHNDNREQVANVLANAYPDAHPVHLAGSADATSLTLKTLHEVKMIGFVTLLLPPMPSGSSFSDLQEIVAHLRAPEGCPWDRKQTLASLGPDLLGEAAEVIEAIELETTQGDNRDHIAEELGDTMMLATLLTQIAIDEKRFRMADVVHHIVEKLIRRHPHVFGDADVNGNDEIVANWDAIKVKEKAGKGIVEGPLDGVPASLPALEKARKMQSKASKAGLMDRAAVAQMQLEMDTLLGGAGSDSALGEARLGKLLWDLVAIAHEQGLNAEIALRRYVIAYREARQT